MSTALNKMLSNVSLGVLIRSRALGMKIPALAEKAGVSYNTVRRARNGGDVKLSTVTALAGALGVTTLYLLTGREDAPEPDAAKVTRNISDVVFFERFRREMSLLSMAAAMGMSIRTLRCHMGDAARSPYLKTLGKMCDALDISVAYLLTGKEKYNEPNDTGRTPAEV